LRDANGDGYEDLYVCSGGSSEVDPQHLQDRLYLNEKNVRFQKATSALPEMLSSTKSITVFDADNDNDLDLFVGGRNKPGKYPDKATSYMLINEGSTFKIAGYDKFYEALPNMITGAETADLNEDGYMDLIVVGEWAQPQVFINKKGKGFVLQDNPELNKLKGWWYAIKKGDFNGDGKIDFVLGNLGQNNKFHGSETNPLSVYFDDFDGNGSQDIFLAKNYKGRLVPVRGKECSSEQLPVLNAKFKSYDAFASSTLAEVLGEDKLSSCGRMEATYFKSTVLINNGNGFSVQELPFDAQLAPILDMEVLDINKDGHLDIIAAGNIFNTEPETPSYDSGKGLVLLNRGNGSFYVQTDIRKTGMNLNRNTKDIAILKRNNGYAILAANNNDVAQLLVRQE